MSKSQVKRTLLIHSCPKRHQLQVETVVGRSLSWSRQELQQDAVKAEVTGISSIDQIEAQLVALNRIPNLYLECFTTGLESGRLYMLVPGLGIYQGMTNLAGEVMISEERIRLTIEESAGNSKEMQRRLRILLGQNWDDLLEPFRAKQVDNLLLFSRAV